jgi:hypothetical protein
MNDNFLSSLAQNIGSGIGNMFQPQQQQQMHQYAQPLPQAAQQSQIPVGQPLTQQNISHLPPQVQQLAQIYNQNPQDPRVAHIDPAIFGYAPDGPIIHQLPLAGHDSIGSYNNGNINSVGGHIGQYGGTIGTDGSKPFANMNHNGQPTDPLAALRSLLGL